MSVGRGHVPEHLDPDPADDAPARCEVDYSLRHAETERPLEPRVRAQEGNCVLHPRRITAGRKARTLSVLTPADSGEGWSDNVHSASLAFHPVAEVWAARELFGYLAARALRVRYKQAALGVLWSFAQPAAAVLSFTLVFRGVLGDEGHGVPYPVFALAGLISWSYLSRVIGEGSLVLVENASLVTKVYFPRIAAPASALLPPLADTAVGLVLLAVLCAAYGVAPTLSLLLSPAWLALLMMSALGACLWLSALNVRYRDVKHAVGPLLQLGLLASPVAYSSRALPEGADWVHAVNPFVGVIELGRCALLGTEWPGRPVAVSAVAAAVLFVSGSWYFQRAERSFADVI